MMSGGTCSFSAAWQVRQSVLRSRRREISADSGRAAGAALARRAVVEFRHESLFGAETYAVIRQHGGALVVADEEKWPRAPDRPRLTAYFRLRRG